MSLWVWACLFLYLTGILVHWNNLDANARILQQEVKYAIKGTEDEGRDVVVYMSPSGRIVSCLIWPLAVIFLMTIGKLKLDE
jgi:ABC-type dipeptide/oligopeptide/nickel transport system permease subunit